MGSQKGVQPALQLIGLTVSNECLRSYISKEFLEHNTNCTL